MNIYIAMYNNEYMYEDNYQCPIGVFSTEEKANQAGVRYCANLQRGSHWIITTVLDEVIVC